MTNKPTHSAYVVIDPKEGGDKKKAQWFEIGTVWSHADGSGFDVVIPPGVTVTGRITCRKRKDAAAADQPTA